MSDVVLSREEAWSAAVAVRYYLPVAREWDPEELPVLRALLGRLEDAR